MVYWIILCLFHISVGQNMMPDERPNIVLMNMDDLGWGDLGITGHPARETPNLDKMAATGLLHTEFYASAAICSPSRASLLTGRLPVRNGFYQNTYPGRNAYTPQEIMGGIQDSEVLLPELLKDAGYRTKLVGKWHLGHQEQFLPLKHGFQEWFGAPNCHFQYNVTWRPGPNIPVYRNDEMIARYYNDVKIDRKTGLSNYTQMLTDEAVEYVTRDSAEPYFLYWAPDSTHAPSYSSVNYVGKSIRDSFYGDAVRELDDSIGKILSAIKSRVDDRKTLVIFTSDNGAALVSKEIAGSNGPLLCGKQTTFEGGFRVPTISWWSRGGPRGVSHTVATQMDLLPSFVELGGGKVPGNITLDGRSIAEVFRTNTRNLPEQPVFYYRGNLLYAVRFGNYKAHYYTWTTPEEELKKGIDHCPGVLIPGVTTTNITKQNPPVLFNLGRDPGERYPIKHTTREYKVAFPKIDKQANIHRQGMVAGEAQLEWCDNAVMNWRPTGCQQLNDCLPQPPSKPYQCYWPH